MDLKNLVTISIAYRCCQIPLRSKFFFTELGEGQTTQPLASNDYSILFLVEDENVVVVTVVIRGGCGRSGRDLGGSRRSYEYDYCSKKNYISAYC